jgi:DNA mismatch endonuclease, patch repair protein
MTDVFSAEKRSDLMRRIRSKDTKPEVRLRRGLHRLGFRYSLHSQELPGKPDIVLGKYRTVVQVRGCFWHGHSCIDGHIPKSRVHYWGPKLKGNIRRDRANDRKLRAMGWSVIVVWECKCMNDALLVKEVRRIIRIINSRS